MMMIYGLMPFMRQTLPYQGLDHNVNYRWASTSRIGTRAASQFLGAGDEKITLSGELRPEITGGTVSLLALKEMADGGRAWPLIAGNGLIYGMYVVEGFTEKHSELLSDGSARKIGFTLSLRRVDESLIAMFGDLKQQAETLIDRAGNLSSVMETIKGALPGGIGND